MTGMTLVAQPQAVAEIPTDLLVQDSPVAIVAAITASSSLRSRPPLQDLLVDDVMAADRYAPRVGAACFAPAGTRIPFPRLCSLDVERVRLAGRAGPQAGPPA
jgi:hypothetical protein